MNKTIIIISIFVLAFLLMIYVLKQQSNIKLTQKKYTIGHITKKEPQKNGVLYHYNYTVKASSYQGTFRQQRKNISIGDRYFIAFDSMQPSQSFLEINNPVPVSLLTAPDDGWAAIPK